MKPKVLFICGSLNQTSMLHKISKELPEFEATFTSYYGDTFIDLAIKTGLLRTSILDGQFRERTENYIQRHGLKFDYKGRTADYPYIVTSNDLLIPKNIRGKPIVLVQEGMTDPENFLYKACKKLHLPLYLSACTAAFGQSDAYTKFCVASPGYRDFFIKRGIKAEKIEVTGVPNWDNCKEYEKNDFPHKHFVLVATSDMRETYKRDNRREFLRKCVKTAAGRPLIFKLHPNENVGRAMHEINQEAPGSLIFTDGNLEAMIANCDVLITQYSTVVYVGLALGKECHTYFDLEELKRLVPTQNGGTSARAIADVCRKIFRPEGRPNL